MSRETQQWLDNNVLVGFTEKRGTAWHWREGTNNHYPNAIPIDDVEKRLFHWEPVKVEMKYDWAGETRVWSERAVVLRNDTGAPLGAHGEGYNPHGYSEWLIKNVGNVLDDTIQIGSAGLLKGGAVAWVQIEMPENRMVEGVAYRPTILATSSLDGSIASTYKAVETIVVCDNTHAGAMNELGAAYKVRQTRNSSFQVLPARERIGIALEAQAEAFESEVRALTGQQVSEKQFDSFLNLVVPVPTDKGRAQTLATNKQDKLRGMWSGDPRVALWKNTVWGVFQLMNTWETHEAIKKGNKLESTLMSTVTGKAFDKDRQNMSQLLKVLENV